MRLPGQGGFFERKGIGRVIGGEFFRDGDSGLAEGVEHLGFAEARGVVFEGDAVLLLIHTEAAESISVGEFAEALELFVAERGMELVADFEKCHAESIAVTSIEWREAREIGDSQRMEKGVGAGRRMVVVVDSE